MHAVLCIYYSVDVRHFAPTVPHMLPHGGWYQVTGHFADKPTRGQSSRGLVNSRTSQVVEVTVQISSATRHLMLMRHN